MQMEGAIIKTYYAQKSGHRPEDIVVVAVMPCTAKKFEAAASGDGGQRHARRGYLPHHARAGAHDHDAGIDFVRLPDEEL